MPGANAESIQQGDGQQSSVVISSWQASKLPSSFNWFMQGIDLGLQRESGANQAMWEPLFLIDENTGKLVPWLGLDIRPDSSQKIWTLKLRPNVRWSDSKGDPANPKPLADKINFFTAADVKFTADLALLHPELPAFEAAVFRSQVESVSAPDPSTVIFNLRVPNPRFAIDNFGGAKFSQFLVLPKHIWDPGKPSDTKDPMTFKFLSKDKNGNFTLPIGTGPYTLFAAKDGEVVWQLNQNWWGKTFLPWQNQSFEDPAKPGTYLPVKRPKAGQPFEFGEWPFSKDSPPGPMPLPQQLEWRSFADRSEVLSALADGTLDVGPALSASEFNTLKSQNPKIIGWTGDGSKGWIDPFPRQLEINVENAPWDNINLRKALSLIIDRKEIAAIAYQGTSIPSRTMFVENGAMSPSIDAIVQAGFGLSPTADVATGQVMIEAEGYVKNASDVFAKDGKELSLAIVVQDDIEEDTRAVQIIVEQLNKAGIKAEALQLTKLEIWGGAAPLGKFEGLYAALGSGSIAEPWTSMSRYTKDKHADIGKRSPGFDDTGRWKSDGYTALVDQLGKMPLEVQGPVDALGRPTWKNNPDIPAKTAEAYKFLADEVPFIPVVQDVKIVPFNTARWTGWPDAANPFTTPYTPWGRSMQFMYNLKPVSQTP